MKQSQIGKRYGRLVIIAEEERHISPAGKSLRVVKCKCDCGNIKNILLNNLTAKNHTQSCGCVNIERSKIENLKHGLKDHTLYRKWYHIKTRCYNPKSDSYYRYGGRGIKVCEEWLNDFKTFYNWSISNGWQEGLEIDRIDNDGNYEPKNCRYVTTSENNHNRSISKLTRNDVLDIRNLKLLIPEIKHDEIAMAFHIHQSTVGQILRNEIWRQY